MATPPMFMAFDCLLLSGKNLRDHRLEVRRDILDRLLDSQTFVLPARRLAGHGLEAWEQVVTQGYEGLVAKDPASKYVAGRTLQWLKVKQPRAIARRASVSQRRGSPLISSAAGVPDSGE